MKAWKDMTPKERAAHARSFIGKAKPSKGQQSPASPSKAHPARFNPNAGIGTGMTQAQRDAILRHPAIRTPRRS